MRLLLFGIFFTNLCILITLTGGSVNSELANQAVMIIGDTITHPAFLSIFFPIVIIHIIGIIYRMFKPYLRKKNAPKETV